MYIVSVTGKTGSGKSCVAKNLSKLLGEEALYIDVDVISRDTMKDEDVLNKAISIWGEGILDNSHNIDRKKFRKVVFSSKENRDMLTKISLPLLKKLVLEKINSTNCKVVILDWAFMPEFEEVFNICDLKILVSGNENIRRKRVILRDNLTEEEFEARDRFSFKYVIEDFNITIQNNNSLEFLEKITEALYYFVKEQL